MERTTAPFCAEVAEKIGVAAGVDGEGSGVGVPPAPPPQDASTARQIANQHSSIMLNSSLRATLDMVSIPHITLHNFKRRVTKVVVQFDVVAALRRHLVRQLTDKLAAANSNGTTAVTNPCVSLSASGSIRAGGNRSSVPFASPGTNGARRAQRGGTAAGGEHVLRL